MGSASFKQIAGGLAIAVSPDCRAGGRLDQHPGGGWPE
jgi:hypothetical protein